MDQFSAVILAAGRGTRMRSSTPKVLHPILGIPMLDHVSRQICAAGSDDLTVVVGHGADQIRKHLEGSEVRTALQDPQRGTGHALLEALDQASPRHSTLVVINGDLPDLDSEMIGNLVETHRQQGQPMTIVTGTVDEPRGMGRVISSPESDSAETCAVSRIVEEA
ncbi:MAG: NTP transferase domain-containing protein, partial [Planctomycetota bacterium]